MRAVFAEPQLSIDVLRPAARDLGITISVLDPLGGTPGREGYVELMLLNARQVALATVLRAMCLLSPIIGTGSAVAGLVLGWLGRRAR